MIWHDGSDGAAFSSGQKGSDDYSLKKVEKGLRAKLGDKLQYEVEEYRAPVPVHPGIRSLKGTLASNKGTGMSFSEIREAAAEAVRPR